jgi:acetamidase/formamidase
MNRSSVSEWLEVQSTPETVRWGRLPSASADPVGLVADGGVIVVDTVSHEGILPDQGQDPVAFFGQFGVSPSEVLDDAKNIAASGIERDPSRDGPHVVTGPIAIAGARPGDLIRIETLELKRRAEYGIVSNRHGKGVLAGELPRPSSDGEQVPVVSTFGRVVDGRCELIEDGSRIRFGLRQFLGLVGLTPASSTELPSTPPGGYGGNLDIRHLGVGSSLLIPVAVDGALLYVADPHFAQGDGEVALTAFEAPLRATLRVSVERGAEARRLVANRAAPYGETDRYLIAIGVGATLDEAMRIAVERAITLVRERTGISESLALAYCSAAVDFEISQAVNGVRGVHALIERADLAHLDEESTLG